MKLQALLFALLCFGIVLLLTSCASLPKETYLDAANLSGIKKVAVVVSVSAPEVTYASANATGQGGLIGLVATVVVLAEDNSHKREINGHVDLGSIGDKMAQSFLQPLKKSDRFQYAEYLTGKDQNRLHLAADGYDAIIRLDVRDISIQKTVGYNATLCAKAHGQMECLATGKVVWDREEFVASTEPRAIAYYEENGLKDLDTILEKAGRNLAYDFVYLK